MTTQTQAMHSGDSTLLRDGIRANSIFCGVSGAIIGALAPAIGQFLGIADANALGSITGVPFLWGLGAMLVLYAGMLYWLTRQPRIPASVAAIVILLDIAWVALSAWVILAGVWPLTTGGVLLVSGLAAIVAVFAAVQTWGLRQMR